MEDPPLSRLSRTTLYLLFLTPYESHDDLFAHDVSVRPPAVVAGDFFDLLALPSSDRGLFFPAPAERAVGLLEHRRPCRHARLPRLVRFLRDLRHTLRQYVRRRSDGAIL